MSGPDFVGNFPYPEIRAGQKEVLEILQANWQKYDVFCIVAPTAAGKSAIAKSIMNATHSASLITPTNLLVKQFRDEFPDTKSLSRMDSYWCEEWKRPCPATRARLKSFCKGCVCSADLAQAKFRRGPGVYNYHTYLAHKLHRDVLIIDEAHLIINTIKDRESLLMWHHDYKYPLNMYKPEQIKEWVASLPKNKQRTNKVKILREAALFDAPKYIAQRAKEMFNGKGTLRGQPEERDCIKLTPVDISEAPPMFWPRDVEKIVMMSATISRKDIEALGLSRKRVLYLNVKSPIDPERRPVIPLNLLPVTYESINSRIDEIAQELMAIADHHKGEKGVIHASYQLARLLRERLPNRFMFHDKDNKGEIYKAFRQEKEDRVLVASGLYEGIDLPEDAGRWQVIAKVPWPSMGDPAVKHLAELDPEQYVWDTIKTFVQACGRICRTPQDYGVTYCIDSTFYRMVRDGKDLLPEAFVEAIKYQ